MIETPKIVLTTAQLTAFIRLTIPREEIKNVMDAAIKEILATLTAQGVTPIGPLVTHHLRADPTYFDFEVGFPVAMPVVAAGRMVPGKLPATTVARTLYHGPYEGLSDAWAEFKEWITAQGHTPATDLWESYLVGPHTEPNPAAWRTELNRPLINKG